MRRILYLAAAHPRAVLLLLFGISLVSLWFVRGLQVHISPQSLTIDGDPARAFYEKTIETFGSDNITVLFLHDPRLFEPEKLAAIGAAVRALQQLPFVNRIQSLYSIPNLRVEDDFVMTEPFLDELPRTPEETREIIAAALKNPFVQHNLLSADGTAMAINIYLQDIDLDQPDTNERIVHEIERAIAPLQPHIETLFQIGLPYIRATVRDRIDLDQRRIMPLAVGVLLIALAIGLRRLNAAIVPLLTAGLSVLWTLGLMAALDLPLNVMTAMVPVLLVIIGSTEDIHLIAEYYTGVREGYAPRHAVRYMARRMGLAVLLTFCTTFMGFLSITANPIQLVREFGLIAASGLAINFAITVLLVPAYLRLFGDSFADLSGRKPQAFGNRMATILADTALVRRKTMIGATLATTLLALLYASDIRVNNSIFNYFEPESEIMQRVTLTHEHLSGLETFSVILNGHIDGTFQKVRYLEEAQKIQGFLSAHPAFDFNVSFVDYVSLLNSVANESGEPELPRDDDILRELLLFVEHRDVAAYVSPDYSRISIGVRHNLASSRDLAAALADIERFVADRVDPDLQVKITGNSILINNAADSMSVGQVRSLLLMLTVIFAVIAVLFLNVKAGLLATLPNLFLVAMLFGVMGFAGIPLDTGTAMIAAIALGVCVDHTMHFMVRYNRKLKEHPDERRAIVETIRDEATPISAASLALAAGLGTLAFSSFPPVAHFGALCAVVMLQAFYANFFITPIVLSYTRLVTLWDLLSLRLRRGLMQSCPLFRGMRPYQVKRIILLGRLQPFRGGETLMHTGDASRELYVVLSGTVLVASGASEGSSDTSHRLTAGEVFGVAALACGQARIATAVAETPGEILALDWTRLQGLARLYPRTAATLFRNLSGVIGDRLRNNVLSTEVVPKGKMTEP